MGKLILFWMEETQEHVPYSADIVSWGERVTVRWHQGKCQLSINYFMSCNEALKQWSQNPSV